MLKLKHLKLNSTEHKTNESRKESKYNNAILLACVKSILVDNIFFEVIKLVLSKNSYSKKIGNDQELIQPNLKFHPQNQDEKKHTYIVKLVTFRSLVKIRPRPDDIIFFHAQLS